MDISIVSEFMLADLKWWSCSMWHRSRI